MEYFWSDGGNNSPYFSYRIKVSACTTEMYEWCEKYNDEDKHFRRFHVEWQVMHKTRNYDIVQFEWERPAIEFALKFGGL